MEIINNPNADLQDDTQLVYICLLNVCDVYLNNCKQIIKIKGYPVPSNAPDPMIIDG